MLDRNLTGESGADAGDLQALSLFRILFSVYLAVDFIANALGDLGALYGEAGIMPLAALASDPRLEPVGFLLPLLDILQRVLVPAVLAPLHLAALLAMALGWRTRWAVALVFVLNSYFYWRNPPIVSGVEVLARLLLLWCLFLPLNRYWSVDAALDPAPRRRPGPSLPVLAIRLQIASLYLFSALFKLAGAPWRDGSALGQALSDTVFGATPTSHVLLAHLAWLLPPATWAVIAFQLAFPFLVYCPWRNDLVRALALGGAALMHLAFIACLNVGGFPYLCLVMLLLLVPDAWIDRLLTRRRARLAGMAIYYDPDCDVCRRVSLVLRDLLVPPATPVLPASAAPEILRVLRAHDSWVVRGADGTLHLRWRALAHLLRRSPVFAPLGWLSDLPGLRAGLDRLYRAIGARRRRLGRLAAALLPFRSDRPPGRFALTLCGTLAAVGLASNLASVARLSVPVPPLLHQVAAVLQVQQSWQLFAPRPTHARWAWRITATTEGAPLDVLQRLPLVSGDPDAGTLAFANQRWQQLLVSLDQITAPQRAAFAAWLCRQAPEARAIEIVMTKQVIERGAAPITEHSTRAACAP